MFLLIKVLNKEFWGQEVNRAKGGRSFPALLKTENFGVCKVEIIQKWNVIGEIKCREI